MANKSMITRIAHGLFFVFVFILYSGVNPLAAHAAKMNTTPSEGSYITGNPFSVSVVIDGENQAFNAAKATINISNNISVEDIILGNCNFSYVDTPTVSDLSFVGVLLGPSKQNCILYTLKLVPLAQGTGQITLSNASVKKAGDALEILNGVKNGSYTFSGNTITPSVTPMVTITENGKPYELSLKVYARNDQPLEGATVIITPQNEQSDKKSLQTTTDVRGIAGFKELPEGMHLVTVERDGEKIAESVITVGGDSKTMVLSIQEQKTGINWFVLAIICAIILGSIVVIARHFRMKKTATLVK